MSQDTITSETSSDPGCCYYYCFVKGRDDSEPWHSRHCCGRTIAAIGGFILFVIGVAAFLAVVAAICFGSGYVGNFVLRFRDIRGEEMNCLGNPVTCGFIGLFYWLVLVLVVITVNGAVLPMHLLAYYLTKSWKKYSMIIALCLTPLYLFGPELLTALVWSETGCNVNSYYGFMEWICMLFGCIILICVTAGWGLIWGIVFLIKCCKGCRETYKEEVKKAQDVVTKMPADVVSAAQEKIDLDSTAQEEKNDLDSTTQEKIDLDSSS